MVSVICLTPAFGQFNWETNIRLENNIGQKFNINYFGVKQNATDGLDLNLGEEDLPTSPVPEPELSAVFYVNNNIYTWTYKEYRAVPDSNNFKKVYIIDIEYGTGASSIDISWDKFGKEIDSAFIEDIWDDVYIYKVNMKTDQTVHLTNHAARLQKITIYYNKSGTGVVENSEKNDIFVYPNPAEDNILLKETSIGENIKIYNQLGICVLDTNYIGEKINISKLDAGLYFIKSNDRLCKFIKL
jgi:hypothetical protein